MLEKLVFVTLMTLFSIHPTYMVNSPIKKLNCFFLVSAIWSLEGK